MGGKLVGVGIATLDHLIVVDSFASAVGEARVERFDAQGGGMVGTALVAAARLGVETEIWTAVGEGRVADWIVAGLEEEGVGLGGLRRVPGADGPLILVFVDAKTGERRFQTGLWARGNGPEPLDLARLEGAACLLVDGIWPAASAEAAKRARELGVPVVADLSGVGGAAAEIVAHTDYLIVDERCAARVAGAEDPERACRDLRAMGPAVAVATLGGRGCAWVDEDGAHSMPAFAVEVADTTGAGDCFHGAFCAGLVKGLGVRGAIELASAAAAIKCTKVGGRAGLPTMAEVGAFLEERRR